jgi:glutathione S-transferase
MNLDDLVLYGTTTSPFGRKVRLALLELGVPFRFEPKSAWNPASEVDRLNPLEKVPVLGLGNGALLWDSRVIVQMLDAHRPGVLLPSDRDARIAALQGEALADGVCEAVIARCVRHITRQQPARKERSQVA